VDEIPALGVYQEIFFLDAEGKAGFSHGEAVSAAGWALQE
jgi:hypothetical protein